MNKGRTAFTILCLLATLTFPLSSYAEVKVFLKNGRSIIADECEESGGQYLCVTAGGTLFLDRQDVSSIKNVTVKKQEAIESRIPSGSRGQETQKTKNGAEAPTSDEARNTKAEEAKKAYERNTQKKTEMINEREKLLSERQQLQKQYNDAPAWMTTQQFNELKAKSDEIDKKVSRFNEEVNRLNEEETKLGAEIKYAQ